MAHKDKKMPKRGQRAKTHKKNKNKGKKNTKKGY